MTRITLSFLDQHLALFNASFETNPLDGKCDQRAVVSSQPVKVIYDAVSYLNLYQWLQSWPKVLGTPGKTTRKIGHLRKMPCVSLLLCLYHTVLVTALPPPTPSNVESACNDSWCEGPVKSTLHWGWRGDARICGVFAKVSQDFWPGL